MSAMALISAVLTVRGCQKRGSPSWGSTFRRDRMAEARARANAGSSASQASSESQTEAKSEVWSQSTERVVLPYPAGAAMRMPLPPIAESMRALSRGRRTTSGRRRGTANFDIATPPPPPERAACSIAEIIRPCASGGGTGDELSKHPANEPSHTGADREHHQEDHEPARSDK